MLYPLSYGRLNEEAIHDTSGALEGTRTPNLLIRSQMLYPLSYERNASSLRGAIVPPTSTE